MSFEDIIPLEALFGKQANPIYGENNLTFNGKKKVMKLSIDTKKDLKNILKKFNKTKFKNYSIKL